MNEFHLILSNPHFACRLGRRLGKFKLIQALELGIGSEKYPPLVTRKLGVSDMSVERTPNELTYFRLLAALKKKNNESLPRISRKNQIFRISPQKDSFSEIDTSVYLSLDCAMDKPTSQSASIQEANVKIHIVAFTIDSSQTEKTGSVRRLVGEINLSKPVKEVFRRPESGSLKEMEKTVHFGPLPPLVNYLPFSITFHRGIAALSNPLLTKDLLFALGDLSARTLSSLASLHLSRIFFERNRFNGTTIVNEKATFVYFGLHIFKKYHLRAMNYFGQTGTPKSPNTSKLVKCVDMRLCVDLLILLGITDILFSSISQILAERAGNDLSVTSLSRRQLLEKNTQMKVSAARTILQLRRCWLAMARLKKHEGDLRKVLKEYETEFVPGSTQHEVGCKHAESLSAIFERMSEGQSEKQNFQYNIHIDQRCKGLLSMVTIPGTVLEKHKEMLDGFNSHKVLVREIFSTRSEKHLISRSQIQLLSLFWSNSDLILRYNFYRNYMKDIVLENVSAGRKWKLREIQLITNEKENYFKDLSANGYMTLLSLNTALGILNKHAGIYSIDCKYTKHGIRMGDNRIPISDLYNLNAVGHYVSFAFQCIDRKQNLAYYSGEKFTDIIMIKLSSKSGEKDLDHIEFVRDAVIKLEDPSPFDFVSLKLDSSETYFVLQAGLRNQYLYLRLMKNGERGLSIIIPMKKVDFTIENRSAWEIIRSSNLVADIFTVTDKMGLFLYTTNRGVVLVGYSFDARGNVQAVTTAIQDPLNLCRHLFHISHKPAMKTAIHHILNESTKPTRPILYAYTIAPSNRTRSYRHTLPVESSGQTKDTILYLFRLTPSTASTSTATVLTLYRSINLSTLPVLCLPHCQSSLFLPIKEYSDGLAIGRVGVSHTLDAKQNLRVKIASINVQAI